MVAGAPADATWVDVSGSISAYHRELSRWWAEGESFAVIEHDVVCRPDVIEQFEQCPEPWCVFPYRPICHVRCAEAWRNMLGCTRFKAEIIVAVPDALSNISDPALLNWHNVCDGLGNNLRARGFTHHWHLPAVDHHPWLYRINKGESDNALLRT